MMHITDWMPTLLKGVAHVNPNGTHPLDGFNMWDALRDPTLPSPRTEILLQLDPPFNDTVNGTQDDLNMYYEATSTSCLLHDEALVEEDSDGVAVARLPRSNYQGSGGCVNSTFSGLGSRMKFFMGQAAIRVGDWKLIVGQPNCSKPCLPEQQCPSGWFPLAPNIPEPPIYNNRFTWLFNITDDPTEHNDLSLERPDIVAQLQERLAFYRNWNISQSHPDFDPRSNPNLFGGWWTPWRHHGDADTDSAVGRLE